MKNFCGLEGRCLFLCTNELAIGHSAGKKLRAELLVRLRDLAGLAYKQIGEFAIFADLQYGSLRQLYLNAKKGSVINDNFLRFNNPSPIFLTGDLHHDLSSLSDRIPTSGP